MKRIDGSYYKEQVTQAVKEYRKSNLIYAIDPMANMPGYQKFLEATKGEKK